MIVIKIAMITGVILCLLFGVLVLVHLFFVLFQVMQDADEGKKDCHDKGRDWFDQP